MSIAVAVKHMLAAGMAADAIVAAVAEMEAAMAPVYVETARDRKREADRIRIATKRDIARQDATSRDSATPLFPPLSSPIPPSELPPIIPPSSLRSDDAPKRKRGSRIAENWKPDTEAAREIGLTESEIGQEARKFVDYWIAAPNGVKLDWDATWRNWCRRVVETRGRSRGPPANGLTGFAAVHEHLRQRNADTLGSEDRADAGGYGSGSAPLLERGHDDGGWFSDRGRE